MNRFPAVAVTYRGSGTDPDAILAYSELLTAALSRSGRALGTLVRGTPGGDWSVGGAKTAYIAAGSPWENGHVESFNARFRDELLDGEIFYSMKEAQVIIESWRRHYNTVRPHGSIGYRPPAPEVFVPAFAAWPAAQPRPAPPAMLTVAPRPTLD